MSFGWCDSCCFYMPSCLLLLLLCLLFVFVVVIVSIFLVFNFRLSFQGFVTVFCYCLRILFFMWFCFNTPGLFNANELAWCNECKSPTVLKEHDDFLHVWHCETCKKTVPDHFVEVSLGVGPAQVTKRITFSGVVFGALNGDLFNDQKKMLNIFVQSSLVSL